MSNQQSKSDDWRLNDKGLASKCRESGAVVSDSCAGVRISLLEACFYRRAQLFP